MPRQQTPVTAWRSKRTRAHPWWWTHDQAAKGSLCIHQDALIHSSVLDPGHHIIYELLPRHSAWLHVVAGKATMGDIVLTQGDGMGVTVEHLVCLTALEHTEILLVDMKRTSQ